jgi:hypothetical protein
MVDIYVMRFADRGRQHWVRAGECMVWLMIVVPFAVFLPLSTAPNVSSTGTFAFEMLMCQSIALGSLPLMVLWARRPGGLSSTVKRLLYPMIYVVLWYVPIAILVPLGGRLGVPLSDRVAYVLLVSSGSIGLTIGSMTVLGLSCWGSWASRGQEDMQVPLSASPPPPYSPNWLFQPSAQQDGVGGGGRAEGEPEGEGEGELRSWAIDH